MKKSWIISGLIAGVLALGLTGCSDPTYPPQNLDKMSATQVQKVSQDFINDMKSIEKKGQTLTPKQQKELDLAIKDNMTSTIEATAEHIKSNILGSN